MDSNTYWEIQDSELFFYPKHDLWKPIIHQKTLQSAVELMKELKKKEEFKETYIMDLYVHMRQEIEEKWEEFNMSYEDFKKLNKSSK